MEMYTCPWPIRKNSSAARIHAKEWAWNNLSKLPIAGVQTLPANASALGEACTPVANKRHKLSIYLMLVPKHSAHQRTGTGRY